MAQRLTNPTRNHEVSGSTPGLAQCFHPWPGHELWCRSWMRLGSVWLWLWLWWRPAAVAPM